MDAGKIILIKEILTEAIKSGASDVHFGVGNYPILRINGELSYLEDKEIITQDFMESLIENILNATQKTQLIDNKEIIFGYNFDKNFRFKVNIFHQRGFLSATLRYIPAQIKTLDELGLQQLKVLAKLKKGLVIVAGPFGSGRSSTAAALVEEINHTRKEYIITVEDPIEHIFNNNKSVIEQREVGKDAKTVASALKSFQEEDGNVLFLEQLTDTKVIPDVLEIAGGSSLVVTTMSSDSAAAAISSILDSFQSFDQDRIRDLLATSLKAVVCQKIFPKIGGGMKVVYELMMSNDAVRATISGGNVKQLNDIIQTSKKDGMVSLEQTLVEAVKNKEINMDDALAVSNNSKLLKNSQS